MTEQVVASVGDESKGKRRLGGIIIWIGLLGLLAILAFTHQMANTQAADFLARVCDALRMRELWVGPRFALGHDLPGCRARTPSSHSII